MAWSRPQYLLMQLSPLTHTSFGTFSLQAYLSLRCSAFAGRCHGLRLPFAQASPLPSRLAKLRHRIEFTCVWDCSFAPGCFPPRLTTTQLPFASPPFPGSVAIRFSLIGLYVVMVTLGSGYAALCLFVHWLLWSCRLRLGSGSNYRIKDNPWPNKNSTL